MLFIKLRQKEISMSSTRCAPAPRQRSGRSGTWKRARRRSRTPNGPNGAGDAGPEGQEPRALTGASPTSGSDAADAAPPPKGGQKGGKAKGKGKDKGGKGKGKSGKWASRSDSSATFALFFRPLLPAAAPRDLHSPSIKSTPLEYQSLNFSDQMHH